VETVNAYKLNGYVTRKMIVGMRQTKPQIVHNGIAKITNSDVGQENVFLRHGCATPSVTVTKGKTNLRTNVQIRKYIRVTRLISNATITNVFLGGGSATTMMTVGITLMK
jgi:hypothetical protein